MDQPRRIPIARPSMGEAEWQALREPIQSGWITQGPKVATFEKAFAARHQARRGVATTSCTTALHLLLKCLGVEEGDEVIVPAFTWVASANVVLHCGATPVLVDVDPATFNLNPARLESAIGPKTKAIMVVHLFGLCAPMAEIRSIAGDIPIVEDAACATGASYRGQSAGSLGHAAAFSFHPRKILTTGEGGMITTNDDELAERAVVLRNHGASVPEEVRHQSARPFHLPDFNVLGFNYRMTDLQAAIGLVQLEKVDQFIQQRQAAADFYRRELSEVSWLHLPSAPPEDQHGWQSFVCMVDPDRTKLTRDDILQQLEEQGVSGRPGTHAVPSLGLYRQRLNTQPSDFPAAWQCQQWSLALPLHNAMSDEDYAYVVEKLKQVQVYW